MKKMKELVSIITPAYNCSKYIRETIEAVLRQTYTQWEMIIVDDCSSDDTTEIVNSLAREDARIKFIILEKNSGAAVARTRAMELAKGQYMAFLDSDDIWYDDKLEKQLAFMKQNNYNITSTSYEKIDEDGNPLRLVIKSKEKTNYNSLLLNCPVGNSTVMYNADNLGKFVVPDIRKRNDDALWLQMLKKEKYIFGMPEILMKYRLRSNSISGKKLSLIKYHWILYRDIEKLSLIRSVFHVCFWIFIKVFRLK